MTVSSNGHRQTADGAVFCISFLSGGIGTFGRESRVVNWLVIAFGEAVLTETALILQGFGLGQFQTILYNMIPGAISIVSNIL